MAQSLQVLTARLREPLIRIQQQLALEKMELTRQSAEKQSATTSELKNEVISMNNVISTYEEQINDLKDMVEQISAFESIDGQRFE
jgi:hypothetical protein